MSIRANDYSSNTVSDMTTPQCNVCAKLSPDDLQQLDVLRDSGVRRSFLLETFGLTLWDLRKHVKHRLAQNTKPEEERPGYESLQDALALPALPTVVMPVVSAPRGYEPGIRFEPGARTATVTLPAADTAPGDGDCQEYLRGLGIDPDLYLLEPIEVRTQSHGWTRTEDGQDATTTQTFYARFKVTRRGPGDELGRDVVEDLLKVLPDLTETLSPPGSLAPPETLLVGLADWQAGKRDGGGAEALVRLLSALGPAIVARVLELQSIGRNIERVILAGLGDWVEGCVGFYPQQTFGVQLDRRQQIRLCMRLLSAIIRCVATLGIPVTVVAVAGNHGENRLAGKSFTTDGDNDDLLVLELTAEAFSEREGYSHVSFVVPNEELFLTLDLSGQHTLFTHGHVARGGWSGLWTWFKNQRAHSNTSATLMVCGHYHHLHLEQDGALAILQCTAGESASTYWTNHAGAVTKPGTTTALVSAAGVRDLAVL